MLAYVTCSVEVYSMVQLIVWKCIHDGQRQGNIAPDKCWPVNMSAWYWYFEWKTASVHKVPFKSFLSQNILTPPNVHSPGIHIFNYAPQNLGSPSPPHPSLSFFVRRKIMPGMDIGKKRARMLRRCHDIPQDEFRKWKQCAKVRLDFEASHHFMQYATVRPPWLSKEKERAVRKELNLIVDKGDRCLF